MKVLVTCPPMIGMIDRLAAAFDEQQWSVHCPEFTQTLSVDELCELVPQFDGWIIGDDPATAQVFRAGAHGKLRAAVKWGIGVDNVDFAAAESCGIPVTNTPHMFGAEVADLAMCYLTALARQTHLIDRGVRDGGWPKPAGISLAGRTVGVIGLGDIGSNFARRAAAADMRIIAYDPGVAASSGAGEVSLASWPERVPECDFLVFTCALNAENRHMMNVDVFASVRTGVRLVNVARGPLIDESALEAALADGTVHSAALDVFEAEPLPEQSRLREHPRCIFGSHNASNTEDAVLRASERAIGLLSGFLGETQL